MDTTTFSPLNVINDLSLDDGKVLISLLMGVGLSASAGFRVFVPLLAASIAARVGILPLGEGFEWIGSIPAIVCFATATLFEIAGYYIPLVDNLLDTITSPASVAAGTLLTASVILPEMDPFLKWGLAIIVGGGSAGIIQAGTTMTRATSTVATAGTGNPLVATAEHILAFMGSLFSLFIPIIFAGIVCLLIVVFLLFLIRYFRKRLNITQGGHSKA